MDCLELAKGPLVSYRIYLHKYFQNISYFISDANSHS